MDMTRGLDFNTFKNISKVPYTIVMDYLFYNENIWKLLYYITDEDGNPISRPLERPNLTSKQKRSLIYNGIDDVNKYRVFLFYVTLCEETTGQV